MKADVPSLKAAALRRPAALSVAAGIFLSRIAGFVRDRVFAHYLGNSDAAGAFRAALRIPNLLQNLFGEGVLSASFIPVYARLLAEGKEEEAGKVAGVVLSLLMLSMSVLVALGILLSRPLIIVLAPGFTGDVRELTIRLVEVMFPGTGLLVLSAWCLGILNSHRKFFISYVAPVLWNLAIISMLIALGGRYYSTRAGQMDLVVWVAWATVIGAALQFFVQLPTALSLNGGAQLSLRISGHVRKIVSTFFPAVMTRGVVQISAYVDQILASFLGPAAVAAMAYAQTVYTLPVSLFGMAISAAELPEMSRATGSQDEIHHVLQGRLTRGLRRLAFFVVPSAVAFVVLGRYLVAMIFQTGRFGHDDSLLVWAILAGSAIGLVATTQGRLCVSALWALGDTKTPLRFATLRVALTAGLGWVAVFPFRESFAVPAAFCAAGLTASAGAAGWVEFLLIRDALRGRIGPFGPPFREVAVFWAVALVSSAAAYAVGLAAPVWHPVLSGAAVFAVYGALYLGTLHALGAPEAGEAASMLLRRKK
jgi:putative peptidoglycan lipid II flippase